MIIDFSARGGKMGTYGFCRGAHPDLTEMKKKRLGARAEKGHSHGAETQPMPWALMMEGKHTCRGRC